RSVPPDEPVALVVVVDTNERGWLLPGAKYTDPMQYLRDTTTKLLREFPENGRYAVYTMGDGPAATPLLGDRNSALNAAAQLQTAGDARLLERIDKAVAALSEMPPEWRRLVVVLSDGNSRGGRPYETVQAAALSGHVAVFAVGTIDPDQPYPFL